MIPAINSMKRCPVVELSAAPESVRIVRLQGHMVVVRVTRIDHLRVNKKRCAKAHAAWCGSSSSCSQAMSVNGLRLQRSNGGRGLSSITKQGFRVAMPGRVKVREGLGTVAVLQEKAPGETSVSNRLACMLVEAVTNEQLQAAATLRSCCFYAYPPGRSAIAAERHRRMKAEDELKVLQRKVRGAEPGFKRVACLIAVTRDADAAMRLRLDGTCQLPFEDGSACVLGTLDVNMGLRLVGEELVGMHPPGADADVRRAYLSNVCVAEVARRRGVAFALIEEACSIAQCWGVEYLYVHVVAENLPATELYFRSGFTLEREESPALSRMLSRPRRLLLRRLLTTF